MDKILRDDLIEFLVSECKRLRVILLNRKRWYQERLNSSGADDEWVKQDKKDIQKLTERVMRFEYFINELQQTEEAEESQ